MRLDAPTPGAHDTAKVSSRETPSAATRPTSCETPTARDLHKETCHPGTTMNRLALAALLVSTPAFACLLSSPLGFNVDGTDLQSVIVNFEILAANGDVVVSRDALLVTHGDQRFWTPPFQHPAADCRMPRCV